MHLWVHVCGCIKATRQRRTINRDSYKIGMRVHSSVSACLIRDFLSIDHAWRVVLLFSTLAHYHANKSEEKEVEELTNQIN